MLKETIMKETIMLAWSVRRKAVVVALGALAFCGVVVGAVVEPIVMQGAKVDGFWHDKYRLVICQWIPHCIRQMESGGAGEELLNLVATGEVLAGKTPSVKFKGCPWSDAYVYNTMEAISLALEIAPATICCCRRG